MSPATRVPVAIVCAGVVCLPVLMTGPAGAQAPAAAQVAAPTPTPTLAARLGAGPASRLSLALDPTSGAVRFLGTAAGHPLARPAGVKATDAPATAARAYIAAHPDEFGTAGSTIAATNETAAPGGGFVVTVTQSVAGVPVLGGEFKVSVTDGNRISAVNGGVTTWRGPAQDRRGPSATVTVSPVRARALARASAARAHAVDISTIRASRARLAIYDPVLLGIPTSAPRALVYPIEVASTVPGSGIRDLILVDAAKGVVALTVNRAEGVLSRTVCNAHERALSSADSATCPGTVAVSRSEGDQATGDTDVDEAYDNAGHVYDFYDQVVGDSSALGVKGPGGVRQLTSITHFCDTTECPFENAYWDGSAMIYGTGFAAADDVVGHELTHSVTDNLSNLYYLYQSGAINESMSDVFGELIDQWDNTGNDSEAVRWLMGEDLPASFGVVRNMRDPGTRPTGFPTPDWAPQPSSMTDRFYDADPDLEDEGGVHTNSGVGNKAAFLIVDGGDFNGYTVPGLGGADPSTRLAAITKAAKIYYRADLTLTSGSDYADLYRVLPQSCQDLIGTAGITDADCASVRLAVQATKMNVDPPKAPAPEAAVCPGGQPLDTRWYDDMERPTLRRWVRSHDGPWYYPPSDNNYDMPMSYATSGTMELWGDDVDPSDRGDLQTSGAVSMRLGVGVPAGKKTYLRFAHAFAFDSFGERGQTHYDDGGLVYYSLDGGPWTSAMGLFDSFGKGTVTGYHYRNGSPTKAIYSFTGFRGDSHGYISSRIALPASFGGHSVRFRFQVRADDQFGNYGWYVDDVRVYTCGSQPSLVRSLRFNRPSATSAAVSWRPPIDPGVSAVTGYTVTVQPRGSKSHVVTLPANRHSFTATGLPAGRPVTLVVRAVNAGRTGPGWRIVIGG